MERTTDIYIAVQKMRREILDQLESDDVLYGDSTAYARKEAEGNGLLRVLHMLEDDFGVTRPWPSLTDHLQRRADEVYVGDRAEEINQGEVL
jgi:hypothetical protein